MSVNSRKIKKSPLKIGTIRELLNKRNKLKNVKIPRNILITDISKHRPYKNDIIVLFRDKLKKCRSI
jgi:hypothetical protein